MNSCLVLYIYKYIYIYVQITYEYQYKEYKKRYRYKYNTNESCLFQAKETSIGKDQRNQITFTVSNNIFAFTIFKIHLRKKSAGFIIENIRQRAFDKISADLNFEYKKMPSFVSHLD